MINLAMKLIQLYLHLPPHLDHLTELPEARSFSFELIFLFPYRASHCNMRTESGAADAVQKSHEFSLNWFFAVENGENGEREKFVGLDSSSSSRDVIIACRLYLVMLIICRNRSTCLYSVWVSYFIQEAQLEIYAVSKLSRISNCSAIWNCGLLVRKWKIII